ncbi:MAG: hypothetical protein RM338_22615 [Nostoc sp. DedQUE12a]|nr:hypothetical protein [Nostoc sp. DedQUE12a]
MSEPWTILDFRLFQFITTVGESDIIPHTLQFLPIQTDLETLHCNVSTPDNGIWLTLHITECQFL